MRTNDRVIDRVIERDTEGATERERTAGHGHPASGRRPRPWLRFAGHYLEMVVAMLVGMAVLGGALRAVLAVAGVGYSFDRYPELVTLEMGVNMAVAMVVWMRFRSHAWAPTLEMAGAMVAPAVAAVPLISLDMLDAGSAMQVEHVAMFALMLAVMLRRRDEYMTHAHAAAGTARAAGAGR